MSNLKIIQLLPELNIGGVERGTKDFSKVLIDQGHKSIVISNGGIFEKDIINDGGKHIKLPIHKKNLSSLFLSKKVIQTWHEACGNKNFFKFFLLTFNSIKLISVRPDFIKHIEKAMFFVFRFHFIFKKIYFIYIIIC